MKKLLLILFIFSILSCRSSDNKDTANKSSSSDNISLKKISDTRIVWGDTIKISLSIKNETPEADSFVLFINNKRLKSLNNKGIISILTDKFGVGTFNIKLKTYYNNQNVENDYLSFIVHSNITPQNLKWTLIKKIPHKKNSYTQGLVYENDLIYESTGQWGQSKLFLINPENGKILKSKALEKKYFGEGITIIKDIIFQVTYKAGEAFIYDKTTFERKHTFRYSNKEGWGLTNRNEQIIMSDGSEKLFFRNPNHFSVISVTEVYTDKGPVYRLNELEYINGKVFANIYGSEKIAIVDPDSGKVLNYINLSGLLKPIDKHPKIDVLNGIAYNENKNQLIVTGKNWPYIYFLSIENL